MAKPYADRELKQSELVLKILLQGDIRIKLDIFFFFFSPNFFSRLLHNRILDWLNWQHLILQMNVECLTDDFWLILS